MRTSLFYLPAIGPRASIEAGRAGLRGDLYDRMLSDISEQAVLADELGYDAIHFTEHHFHIEGFEISNNPVLLDLFVAMQTKRIKVGQLGIVLPAENPVRVAENIAMLDRMTGGRACAGFARGYQRRWVDVMAQQTHGIHFAEHGAQSDEVEAANRAAFEECFEIIKRCWTEDMLAYDGKFWRIPAPNTPWDVEATRRYGAGADRGVVTSVGVVPKPVQKPHPQLFQPFSATERSVSWCAENGVVAVLPPVHPKREARLIEVYSEVSGKKPGDGIAFLRNLIIADSDEEAQAIAADSSAFVRENWLIPFGIGGGIEDPETGAPLDPEEFRRDGYTLIGTVDSVTRQLERLMERRPANWIFAWCYASLIPNEKMLKSLELYATKVLPRLAAAG